MIRVTKIQDLSLVNGIGARMLIFFPGCPHNCDGCQNPELQDYAYGNDWEIDELIDYIKLRKDWIDGITLTGGDPLFQLNIMKEFLIRLRKDPELKHLDIWLYTGYLFEQIPGKIKMLLNVIIDGKYDKTRPIARWRGSDNQRLFQKVIGKSYKQIKTFDDIDRLREEYKK